jgi:outer membrane protein, adhesin transport system
MKKNKSTFSKLTIALLSMSLVFSAKAESLSDSIRYAIHFNPDVLFQVTHRYTTHEQYAQARADEFPVVDLNAGYGADYSQNPTATNISGNNRTYPQRQTSLSVTENIFKGFGTVNEINRTRETMKSSAWKLRGVANDVALNVTEQYLNVLRQQTLLSVAQDNVAQHQQILNMIKDRTGAGIDRQADMNQAQGRFALARANLVAAKSYLDDASVRFTQLVGCPPHHLIKPATPGFPQIPKSETTAVQFAVANHPTLRSALADVSAALAQHQASKAVNYPQLDFVLSASRDRNIAGIQGENKNESAMVRMNYNLFKGGKDAARQRETAYEVQEAEEVKNRTILQVESTLRLSWNALVNTQLRLTYLASHISAAQSTLTAYKEQFTAGKRSLFDLLDAQNEYYQSRADYVSAQYDLMFSRYRILNAMGNLLGYLHVSLPEVARAPKEDAVVSLRTTHVKVIRDRQD